MNKKIKFLVLISLLLNVLLIGILAGRATHLFHWRYLEWSIMKKFTSELPADKAALFRDTVEKVRSRNRGAYQQLRLARQAGMEILSAPEFDEASYRQQIEKIYDLRNLMKRRLADATIELARKFNQEERTALARHLRYLSRHAHKRDKSSEQQEPFPGKS